MFNYLFARGTGGEFILRLEDTDAARTVAGARGDLLSTLRWAGLTPDRGFTATPSASDAEYVQSARTRHYAEAAEQLLESGAAYRCFCTPDEIEAGREAARAAGRPPFYARTCLGLEKEEGDARAAHGVPHVIRMRIPDGETVVDDAVYGRVGVGNATLDDSILVKSDGRPTYHLANVVDDLEMGISHVIRGQEWLISTPKHVLLYDALGRREDMPVFAHLPLLLDTERKKLSKRDAAASVATYREAGFLPSALLNFVAFLGWSPNDAALEGRNSQALSLDDLVSLFSLGDVNKGGGIVDMDKARAVNASHLASLFTSSPSMDLAAAESYRTDLVASTLDALDDLGLDPEPEYVHDVWSLFAPSLGSCSVEHLLDRGMFMFAPPSVESKVIQAKVPSLPPALVDTLIAHTEWDSEDALQAVLLDFRASSGLKPGKILPPLRAALTGETSGPELSSVLHLLGRDESVARLSAAVSAVTPRGPI